jgi:hypothetical protein
MGVQFVLISRNNKGKGGKGVYILVSFREGGRWELKGTIA